MSDESSTEQQPSQPDDREPTPERQAELRVASDANVTAGRAPYQRVHIRTRGELLWIMRAQNWTGDVEGDGKERANLSRADLHGAMLSGVHLHAADLSGAYLKEANLSAAQLRRANLTDARLNEANLAGADLIRANLSGTNLFMANLRGANLLEARMDVATALIVVALDSHTKVLDVAWNSVRLGQVDWEQAPSLGDEEYIAKAKGHRDRAQACRRAARAYGGLAIALRAQGLLIPASRYRLREQQLERQAAFWDGKPLTWLFSCLLSLVAGYGERPARIFGAYLLIVSGFAAAYYTFGTGSGLIPGPVDALVFSVTSFHGRGFFPNENIGLHHPLTILAALEAVVGLFIELILIATFSRRFLGN